MALMERPATGPIAPAPRRETMWHGFTPLEPMTFTISPRAAALLGEPVGFRLTGEELVGCDLWPGDLLLVDAADRDPQPGPLVAVWGFEADPDPDPAYPEAWADLSPALLAKIRPTRPVPVVGQYWPTPRTGGGQIIDIRAVLPDFPAPVGILDYALDDLLIGVVHGYYATGARDYEPPYDFTGWDFDAAIHAARERMTALDALTDGG